MDISYKEDNKKNISYKKENQKDYCIKLSDRNRTLNAIKSFLSKNGFTKQTMMCELKVGYNDDSGQLYSKRKSLKYDCDFFFQIEKNELKISIYKGLGDIKIMPNDEIIKVVENLIIDLKIINNYPEKDIPEKNDTTIYDNYEKHKRFMEKYNKVTETPGIITMLGSPILLIVMLITKFKYPIINWLFGICLSFFIIYVIVSRYLNSKEY